MIFCTAYMEVPSQKTPDPWDVKSHWKTDEGLIPLRLKRQKPTYHSTKYKVYPQKSTYRAIAVQNDWGWGRGQKLPSVRQALRNWILFSTISLTTWCSPYRKEHWSNDDIRPPVILLAWIFHELLSRDHEDGCACPPSRACSLRRGGRATGQPQGVGSEAYLCGTSQGELVLPVPSLSRGE